MRRTLFLFLLAAGCAGRMTSPDIDALFASYAGNNPGAAVAVVKDGKVVYRKGYGLADVVAGTAVTPSTNFRLASVTKHFIAAGVTILAERRALSYDDPISRWLPSLPQATKAITIGQLLNDTSGIVDYEDLIPESQTEQLSDADALRMLESADRTLFPPGSKYQYSNSGYVLLGLILERASGQSLGEFLRREIFAKHGMRNSVLMDRGATIVNRAYGHPKDQSITSATRGDGAIYSNVDDLARWAASLDAPKPDTLVETETPGVRYGFGWFVNDDTIWHTGSTSGFRNAFVRFPKERLTIIVLTNRNEGEPIEIAKKMR